DSEYVSSQKLMITTGLGEVGKLRAQAAIPALQFIVGSGGDITGGGIKSILGLSTMDKSQQVWIRVQRQRSGSFSTEPGDNLYLMGGVKSEAVDLTFDAETQRYLEVVYSG